MKERKIHQGARYLVVDEHSVKYFTNFKLAVTHRDRLLIYWRTEYPDMVHPHKVHIYTLCEGV